MAPMCAICGNKIPASAGRYTLTAKLARQNLSIAEVLNNWGVPLSEEEERWLICKACNYSLSCASTKRRDFDIALSRLYDESSPSVYIGQKLREFITTLRREAPISTPSSTSCRACSCTPRGKKRSRSTKTTGSLKKKTRLSRSREKTPQTTPGGNCREINSHRSPSPLPREQGTLTRNLAAKYVRASRYGLVCRLLRKKSKAFTREVQKLVKLSIGSEIRNLGKSSTSSLWRATSEGNKIQSYQSFSWKEALSEAKIKCPFLYATVLGAATARRPGSRRAEGSSEIAHHLKPALGTVLGMLMFLGEPKKLKVFHELISLELWLSHCRPETFKRLSGLGMCLSRPNTIACIDKVIRELDDNLMEKKKELEASEMTNTASRTLPSQDPDAENEDQVMNGEDQDEASMDDCQSLSSVEEQAEISDATDEDGSDEEERSISSKKADGKKSLDSPESPEVTSSDYSLDGTIDYSCLDRVEGAQGGFTIIFDNVNEITRARYSARTKDDEMPNMVQAYAAFDRVPSYHLDDTPPTANDILQIDPKVYLPNEDDEILLRREYTVIVQRILTRLMPCFQQFAERVEDHIPHPHFRESKQKSKIVPLGVLSKDETKTSDMVDILRSYHDHVPYRDGKPINTILYGEGPGCERVRDAQSEMLDSTDSQKHLDGLYPTVQEWHKHCLLLEDTYKLLYDVRSSRAVGTLSYIKYKFHYRNVEPDTAAHSFDAATDLLQLSTEAYVVAAACVQLGLDDPSKMPEDLPEGIEGLYYFHDVSLLVVDMAFEHLEVPESENEPYPYCICHTDIEDEMVLCKNPLCSRGSWFHITCMNMSPEDVAEGKYFCSEECSEEWQKQKGLRFQSSDDHILQYSRAVLFRGLGERARHDAIRENDGERIISHWRFDMIEFHEMHHPKYFIEGFHLLTDMNGGASERMAHQMKWNRTVNMCGGRGHNVSMGFAMNRMNKEFKLAMKACGGNLTPSMLKRYSRILGIRKDLQSSLDLTKSKCVNDLCGSRDMQEDTLKLAKLLLDNDCLKEIPGRSHSGFGDFVFEHALTQQHRFIERIENHKKKRAERMDTAQENASIN